MSAALNRVVSINLARAWASYREMAMPADAGETQVTETRRAFVAGMFEAITLFADIGLPEVPEDDGVEAIARLNRECLTFYEDVKAGRA